MKCELGHQHLGWTKKNNETFYGYKNHAKVDTKSKFISTLVVTDASVHDSQATADLLNEKDKGQELYADRAYTGQNQEETIAKHEMVNKVKEKGYKNKPLNDEQKKNNTEKSKTCMRKSGTRIWIYGTQHERIKVKICWYY